MLLNRKVAVKVAYNLHTIDASFYQSYDAKTGVTRSSDNRSEKLRITYKELYLEKLPDGTALKEPIVINSAIGPDYLDRNMVGQNWIGQMISEYRESGSRDGSYTQSGKERHHYFTGAIVDSRFDSIPPHGEGYVGPNDPNQTVGDLITVNSVNRYVTSGPEPQQNTDTTVVLTWKYYSYSWVQLNVTYEAFLFDQKNNKVIFNALTPEQSEIVKDRSFNSEDLYKGLGGNDIVVLPDNPTIAPGVTFTTGRTFFGGTGDDKITGSKHGDTIDGGADNDTIDGSAGNDTIDGSAGNDIIDGGADNDRMEGGAGNDRIDGGAGKDTAIFSGKFSDYTLIPKGLSGSGGTLVQVRDKRGKDGVDTLTDVEVAKFADQSIPLSQWEFKVVRMPGGKKSKDGDATISLFENGKPVAGATGIKAWFDDATPILTKTSYEAIFRTDGNVSGWKNCIELSDGETGASTVKGRTAIQIHGGKSPQNSEGCIVLLGDPLRKMLGVISADYSNKSGSPFDAGQTGLHLPFPIKVTIAGEVRQPKINMPNTNKYNSVSDKKKSILTPEIYFKDSGNQEGITKTTVVTFTVGGQAKYKEDFEFGNAVKVINAKKGLFSIEISPNKDKYTLPIEIIADKKNVKPEGAEKITFTMTKVALYNEGHPKGYVENGSGVITKLLADDKTFSVTIKADSAPAKQAVKKSTIDIAKQSIDYSEDTFVFDTKPGSEAVRHVKDFRAADDTVKLDNAVFAALKTGKLHADDFATIASKSAVVDADAHVLYEKATGTLYYDANGGSASGRVPFAVLDNHANLSFQDFLVV